MDYRAYFDWLMGPLGKSAADLMEGCEECDWPEAWPETRVVAYAYLVLAIYALSNATGRVPAITSGYRCGPCNERRGGAPRSRHLGGAEGGAPYAAIDIQWPAGYLDAIIAQLDDMPSLIRQAIKLRNVGIGVIAYAGKRRLHIDLRERDYVENQT